MTTALRLENLANLVERFSQETDKRFARLDERLEAIAGSLELVARAQHESEKRHAWVVDTLVRLEGSILDHDTQIGKLTQTVAAHDAQIGKLTEAVTTHDAKMRELNDSLDRLARTVERYIRARGNGANGSPESGPLK